MICVHYTYKGILIVLIVSQLFPDNNREKLGLIDNYVRERPDSAITELASIDRNSLRKKDQARYDLVYATALERSFSDTSDINIILPALHYFEKHGPKEYLMRSYHCLGRFYQNEKDWQNAYLSYKKAEELAEYSSDYYFKTVLYSCLRYVLGVTHHNDEWLSYCKKTLDYSSFYGKDLSWICRDLLEYSAALSDCGMYEKSDSVFKVATPFLARESANQAELLYGAETAMKKVEIMPSLAIEYTERALSQGAHLNEEQGYLYSYALVLQGQLNKANRLLDSLRTGSSSINAYFWNYKICRRLKDYKSAMEYCEEFDRLRFEDYNDKNNFSVHKAEAERNEAIAALNKAESHILRLMFLLAVLLFIGLIAIALYRYQSIKRKRQEELSKMEDFAEETSRLLHIANSDYHQLQGTHLVLEEKYIRLQQSFCSSYQSQLSELGRLCEKGISNIEAATIKNRAVAISTEKIEKIIKDIGGKKEGQDSLEKEIDSNLDGIITKIRKDFPEFDNEDILFICYMAMHFDTTTIAFLADISKTNIRVKKHRYREKIFSKPTSNLDLYRVVLQ